MDGFACVEGGGFGLVDVSCVGVFVGDGSFEPACADVVVVAHVRFWWWATLTRHAWMRSRTARLEMPSAIEISRWDRPAAASTHASSSLGVQTILATRSSAGVTRPVPAVQVAARPR